MASEITREEVCASIKKYLIYHREYWEYLDQFFAVYKMNQGSQTYVPRITRKVMNEIQTRQRKLHEFQNKYERKMLLFFRQIVGN